MDRNTLRTLVGVAVGVLLVVGILLAAGAYVRSVASTSFEESTSIANLRTGVLDVLKLQLDEETGVRGYEAEHDAYLLEPYRQARTSLGASLAPLRAAIDGIEDARASEAVRDLAVTHDAWVDTVAKPILRHREGNPVAIQRVGKTLVDRMRTDVHRIDSILIGRQTAANQQALAAIDHVNALVVGAVGTIALIAIVFLAIQAALGARLAEVQAKAEEERRKTAEVRAAYLTEKRIADTLQTAFSQRPLPSVPTLRFSATYVPATEEANVGGDWYDAMEIPGDRVLFAIGDVAGHGIDAAVTMNRARQAVISAALLNSDPAFVLARASADLERQKSPMVTAIAGYADARTYEFAYAAAGHPPPVLMEPGRPPRLLEFGSVPLAVMSNPAYRTHRVQSVPGALLVLYTDGALEHSRDVLEGERILLSAVAQVAEHPESDSASIIHDAIFDGRAAGDDVAILTVGFEASRSAAVYLSGESAGATFAGRVRGAERKAS